jgi:AcrR family transcriptional regulator
MSPAPPTRAGLTPERLTAAAAELADESGLGAVTASALARRFGVSPASLYSHVRNLEALHVRLTALSLTELAERASAAIGGRAGKDALAALADAYRSYAAEHPGRYAAAVARITPDSLAAAPARRNADLTLAILRGYPTVPASEHVHAVRLIGATIHGFITLEARGAYAHSGPTDPSWSRAIDALDLSLRHWPADQAGSPASRSPSVRSQ